MVITVTKTTTHVCMIEGVMNAICVTNSKLQVQAVPVCTKLLLGLLSLYMVRFVAIVLYLYGWPGPLRTLLA